MEAYFDNAATTKVFPEVKDLVVKYGEITAISGISLEAEEGQLTTLIGSNGAGKSTLLKVLSGLMKPAGGQIIFDGKDITGRSCDQIVRLGISPDRRCRRIFEWVLLFRKTKQW